MRIKDLNTKIRSCLGFILMFIHELIKSWQSFLLLFVRFSPIEGSNFLTTYVNSRYYDKKHQVFLQMLQNQVEYRTLMKS